MPRSHSAVLEQRSGHRSIRGRRQRRPRMLIRTPIIHVTITLTTILMTSVKTTSMIIALAHAGTSGGSCVGGEILQ